MFITIAYQSVKFQTTVGIVYLQRERCFKQKNRHNYSRKLFIDHLVNFISQLRAEEYNVILVVVTNENSIDRKLNKAL